MAAPSTIARTLLREASRLAKQASEEPIEKCLPTLREALDAMDRAEKLILDMPTVPVFRSPSDPYRAQEIEDAEV